MSQNAFRGGHHAQSRAVARALRTQRAALGELRADLAASEPDGAGEDSA